MHIICPIHARERMEQRGITREQIVQTINHPDISLPTEHKRRKRAMRRFGPKTLDVIYEPRKNNRVVLVTALWLKNDDRKVGKKK